MKKWDWKRLGLGFSQHAVIMCIMLMIAGVLFNSYFTVETGQGTKIYSVDLMDTSNSFEETELYHSLFSSAIGEIINLVVLKEELETEGYFDPEKKIDISAYALRKQEEIPTYHVTAHYRLEDLIKWGRAGLNYTDRIMSKKEFINFFDMNFGIEHFGVDEFGQLYFRGFHPEEIVYYDYVDEAGNIVPNAEYQLLEILYNELEQGEMEDMVYAYIMAQSPNIFTISKAEDGLTIIRFPMLKCLYGNVNGDMDLISQVDNWMDFAVLQTHMEECINSVYEEYEQYKISNTLYAGHNTNLKYCIRLSDEDGETTYSNVPDMADVKEDALTEFFSEYKRYFIYYPDDLEFSGNTILTEEDIYDNLNLHAYAFPDTTHIWMGIDTDYAVVGDAFHNGDVVYDRVVPNMPRIMLVATVLMILWVVILVYLSMTTGIRQDEEGNISYFLFRLDHVWTELVLAVLLFLLYGFYRGFQWIMNIAEVAHILHMSESKFFGISTTKMYEYGAYGIFGFLISLGFCIIWYSLVRRMRSHNLWRDSILYYVVKLLKKAVGFILYHGNVATRILIPYNFFLLVNLAAGFMIYRHLSQVLWVILLIICIVLFDGAVGSYLFKQNAERNEIVEGIKRIRSGEVDYQLDVENLKGENLQLADAVNNIGEGIRIAVKTSMKDEQMKTDLITNVSHDIKTPLTSIVSYVDLLKRLRIKEEPIKSYIEVLDAKSQRLKQLTDDLVEASKISSGNITLQMERLNLTELVNQALGEFDEKLADKQLTVIFPNSGLTACICADSRRMWRVIENLFNNLCKYALENTRVYIDLLAEDGKISLSVKNISACQMNIKPEELTERFIRGDSARSTEGSGLGLSIAKSLTQVQGGSFDIYVDGDLFKVTISFDEYREQKDEEPVVTDELEYIE
ncbi:MAG: HAMP domain-containing histidine kinase [Lachnospiraceae bacterium]|nr:HAMP domain-containing histidine kinase [Lachnospiraceae bacterium]